MSEQAQVTIGERIYYTGDMANPSAWLIVQGIRPNDVILRQDDGHIVHIYPQAIGSVYRGHCNPRFVTEAAFDTYWRAKR